MKLQFQNPKFKIISKSKIPFGNCPPEADPPLEEKLKIGNSHLGISLLLAVTVLGGLILVTAAATDLVLTVTRSSRTIGNSETAYFAAETAVERALLDFEKNGAALGALNKSTTPLPGNASATYTTSAAMETHVPTDDTRLSVPDPSDPISTSNELTVTLAAGETLYFDFATNGASYPSNVRMSFANGRSSEATVIDSNEQALISYSGSSMTVVYGTNVQTLGNDTISIQNVGSSYGTRLKVKNTAVSAAPITIRPTGGDLPIGVLITGVGRYRGAERRIEVFRPNYVIY